MPARVRAEPHTASSTSLGSDATVVSRRGAARAPMVPATIHPPSRRRCSDRRERRPDVVLAVTVTRELIALGAVSTRRARWPALAPGRTVSQTTFSWTVSGPTSGAKRRPRWREDHAAG